MHFIVLGLILMRFIRGCVGTLRSYLLGRRRRRTIKSIRTPSNATHAHAAQTLVCTYPVYVGLWEREVGYCAWIKAVRSMSERKREPRAR
jgi:hypothetical protein